jgi:hypothetical protein
MNGFTSLRRAHGPEAKCAGSAAQRRTGSALFPRLHHVALDLDVLNRPNLPKEL